MQALPHNLPQKTGAKRMHSENCVFLAGALRCPDILRLVVGEKDLTPASLEGFSENMSVPGIWQALNSAVQGAVLNSVDAEDRAKLDFYGEVYGAVQTQVKIGLSNGTDMVANAYVTKQNDLRFELPDALNSEAVHMRMAEEIMMYYNDLSAEYVTIRLPGIFRRATSYVTTRAMPADPDRDLSQNVVIKERKRPYMNFFAVEENDLQFRRYDGQLSNVVNRGTIHVGQVMAVLPYDPVLDCVLLVEQFRAAVMMSGSLTPWVWQPVAGLIDPGETSEAAAHREAKEEAGLTLSGLERAGQAYSSPGSSTEYMHLFVGIADLRDTQAIGGLAEEDEDIRSRVLSFEELIQAVDLHQFQDLPLLMLANWLARHRDRLRLMA